VLDPMPYGGVNGTLEALAMAVPVVTLVGERHAERTGYSMLVNLGVTETIATSESEYVGAAVRLATDSAFMERVRAAIRGGPREFGLDRHAATYARSRSGVRNGAQLARLVPARASLGPLHRKCPERQHRKHGNERREVKRGAVHRRLVGHPCARVGESESDEQENKPAGDDYRKRREGVAPRSCLPARSAAMSAPYQRRFQFPYTK
jgi:hypothetical protein